MSTLPKYDYEGDRALARSLLAANDAEAIALALRNAWHRGNRAAKSTTNS